jgi:hypothetical protein
MSEDATKPGARASAKLSRSLLDRLFYGIVTYGWDETDIARYPERLHQYTVQIGPDLNTAFEQIDAKATGLLTHVSLMIAGLGLIAPLVADNRMEVGVVIAEIAVYLLIAVGTLRCLSVFHWNEFGDQTSSTQDLANHELIIRRELYSLCIRSAIFVTIAVFLLLPVLYFWTPEK